MTAPRTDHRQSNGDAPMKEGTSTLTWTPRPGQEEAKVAPLLLLTNTAARQFRQHGSETHEHARREATATERIGHTLDLSVHTQSARIARRPRTARRRHLRRRSEDTHGVGTLHGVYGQKGKGVAHLECLQMSASVPKTTKEEEPSTATKTTRGGGSRCVVDSGRLPPNYRMGSMRQRVRTAGSSARSRPSTDGGEFEGSHLQPWRNRGGSGGSWRRRRRD